jgi:hypothetical protein
MCVALTVAKGASGLNSHQRLHCPIQLIHALAGARSQRPRHDPQMSTLSYRAIGTREEILRPPGMISYVGPLWHDGSAAGFSGAKAMARHQR